MELLTRALQDIGAHRESSGKDGARVGCRDAEVGLKLTKVGKQKTFSFALDTTKSLYNIIKLGKSDNIEAFLTTLKVQLWGCLTPCSSMPPAVHCSVREGG